VTEYLIAARAAIILWTTLAVMPAEFVFDAIEAEMERRGIEPYALVARIHLSARKPGDWRDDFCTYSRPR